MAIIAMVANGMTSKEIADCMDISLSTVKNVITQIMERVGVGNRTELAIYALEHGWVKKKPC